MPLETFEFLVFVSLISRITELSLNARNLSFCKFPKGRREMERERVEDWMTESSLHMSENYKHA